MAATFFEPVGSYDRMEERARGLLDFRTTRGVEVQTSGLWGGAAIAHLIVANPKPRLSWRALPPPSCAIGFTLSSELAHQIAAAKAAAERASGEVTLEEAEEEDKMEKESGGRGVPYSLRVNADVMARSADVAYEASLTPSVRVRAMTYAVSHPDRSFASALVGSIAYDTRRVSAEFKATNDERLVGVSAVRALGEHGAWAVGGELMYSIARGGGCLTAAVRHTYRAPAQAVRQAPSSPVASAQTSQADAESTDPSLTLIPATATAPPDDLPPRVPEFAADATTTVIATVFGHVSASLACTLSPLLRAAVTMSYNVLVGGPSADVAAAIDTILPIGVRLQARLDSARGPAVAFSAMLAPRLTAVLSVSAAPRPPQAADSADGDASKGSTLLSSPRYGLCLYFE